MPADIRAAAPAGNVTPSRAVATYLQDRLDQCVTPQTSQWRDQRLRHDLALIYRSRPTRPVLNASPSIPDST